MINPLFHLTILPPKMPAAEALSQEIAVLQQNFGGELCHINPNDTSPFYVPRFLFGFQKLMHLRQMETHHKIHHFFNPDPFPFQILRFLQRPVVYTITSGVGLKPPNLRFFSRLPAIVVPDERSLKQLQLWGLTNVHCVRSGIATNRFTHISLPITDEIRVLCASAPWTKDQFTVKGFDALLQAVAKYPKLHLTFLWRKVLVDEIVKRVEKYNVGTQVQIINKHADVNQILGTVHATIVLSTKPGIVKSYPHSLLESLAAGKPVIVSRAIPMSDYVEKENCGVVQEEVTASAVIAAVTDLSANYAVFQMNAKMVGRTDFSQTGMIDAYRSVYDSVL